MSVDKLNFGRVAVLFGGTSAEREISLISGQAVLSALQAAGVNAEAFDPAERHIADIKTYDRAFIVLHGRGGEDGTMQGALELLNIPYTGSGVLASALGMDKTRTKMLWLGCGLPTPSYARLTKDTNFEQVITDLGLPLMVKPAREGSSIGMRKVEVAQDLEPAYAFAAQYDSEIIAEKWVTGKEYTIVILGDKALPVIRLQPHQSHCFYDFDAKYNATDTQYLCPCGLAADDEQRLQALAVKAFEMVGAKGWGRIDAMQDQDGNFWLLEVNTVPGMTDHSLVPMAARAAGLSFQELVVNILSQTL